LGTSTTTSYVESAAGVTAGGRTGLTGIVVAGCFLLALFFTPLIAVIPWAATAPALVLVGVFMVQGLKQLDFDDLLSVAPAFVTLLAMPLTFSISEGIALGFITHAGLMAAAGRWRDVSWLTWVLAALFLLHYFVV
jgi:AGZA family xanthine/uracil permease-like MFS transporter